MVSLGELCVADIMTPSVLTVDNSARLSDAIRNLDQHRLHAAPVVDSQGEVVGMLSVSDLISIFHEIQVDLNSLPIANDATREFLVKLLIDQGDNTRVEDVMTAPVETVSAQTNLVIAARLLMDRRIHQLPILNNQNHPIGILSTTDFVKAFAQHAALYAG